VVDSGAYSEEEKAWIETIRESYPGYTPPRLMPGAVVNNTQEKESAVIEDKLAPASDPVSDKSAGNAVEKTAVKPAEKASEFKEEEPNDPEVESMYSEADGKKSDPEVKKDAKDAKETKEEEVKKEVKEADGNGVKAEEKKAEVKSEPTDPTGSDVYVVKSGDTLGKIAQRAYGSARHSGVIFKANSDIIKNPDFLKPGMRLIIPKL
jgi:nucleoid-associated protein YgaU